MKKLIITTALFAFAAVPVFAQTAKLAPAPTAQQSAVQPMSAAQRSERMADHQAKSFEQQYKLSADQYKGIYSACLEFAKSIEAARASGQQSSREDVMKALEVRNQKFKSIMTPEQYKAYEATLSHSAPQPVPAKPQPKN